MIKPTEYKIAETFTSIQGEGHWTGTPMTFWRLSQCPVGGAKGICRMADGREFVCDTGASYKPSNLSVEFHNYTEVNRVVSAYEIVKNSLTERICISGGEPFIYNMELLIRTAYAHAKLVHIETSGTVELDNKTLDTIQAFDPWITWSPKFNYNHDYFAIADEVKLLVDADSKTSDIANWWRKCKAFNIEFRLQPIEVNGDPVATKANLDLVYKLCLANDYALSLQTHKFLAVR